MKRLILASSSPRRHELLRATGLPFEVARPDIDETPHPGENPADYVTRLSREKAEAISGSAGSVILSADTTVADDQHVLGKPNDPTEAIAMLRRLRGRPHRVHTAVTVRDTGSDDRSTTQLTTSQVMMRDLSNDEIAAYVESGDPMGKAGAYAIQNAAFHPVAQLDGCYTNVVGLPMCAVCALLAEYGLPLPQPVPCSPSNLPCQFRLSS